MNAHVPPSFCASATACNVSVVLPEDSGPKISMTRPRGSPPTPSARSSDNDPVGMTSTSCALLPSSGMIAPLPNCFSMAAMAACTALKRSLVFMISPLAWSNDGAVQELPANPLTLLFANLRDAPGEREQHVVAASVDGAVLEPVVRADPDLPIGQDAFAPVAQRFHCASRLQRLLGGEPHAAGAEVQHVPFPRRRPQASGDHGRRFPQLAVRRETIARRPRFDSLRFHRSSWS